MDFTALEEFLQNACKSVNLVLDDVDYHREAREIYFYFSSPSFGGEILPEQLDRLQSQIEHLPHCYVLTQEGRGKITLETNDPVEEY